LLEARYQPATLIDQVHPQAISLKKKAQAIESLRTQKIHQLIPWLLHEL